MHAYHIVVPTVKKPSQDQLFSVEPGMGHDISGFVYLDLIANSLSVWAASGKYQLLTPASRSQETAYFRITRNPPNKKVSTSSDTIQRMHPSWLSMASSASASPGACQQIDISNGLRVQTWIDSHRDSGNQRVPQTREPSSSTSAEMSEHISLV